MAAQQLHIGALGVGREYALRSPFEAIELAGDQRFERKLVVLELRNFNLEPLFLRKVARRYHQEDAGVGFCVDQAMLPDLFLSDTGNNQAGQCRDSRDGCKRNPASFHASSSLASRLDGVCVVLFLGNSSIIWAGGATPIERRRATKQARAVQRPRVQPL